MSLLDLLGSEFVGCRLTSNILTPPPQTRRSGPEAGPKDRQISVDACRAVRHLGSRPRALRAGPRGPCRGRPAPVRTPGMGHVRRGPRGGSIHPRRQMRGEVSAASTSRATRVPLKSTMPLPPPADARAERALRLRNAAPAGGGKFLQLLRRIPRGRA